MSQILSTPQTNSPIHKLPDPLVVKERMGQLYRELNLLRRLLRLSQAAYQERMKPRSTTEAGEMAIYLSSVHES